uniref:Uncharacterized protein n=1 Tax=Caenorhabditis japonica TaxID=281687 RepID=A0A8R1ISK4_CAEJA
MNNHSLSVFTTILIFCLLKLTPYQALSQVKGQTHRMLKAKCQTDNDCQRFSNNTMKVYCVDNVCYLKRRSRRRL